MQSKAYEAGYSAAYFGGVSFDACPYERGTEEYTDWKIGWLDCEEDHYSHLL